MEKKRPIGPQNEFKKLLHNLLGGVCVCVGGDGNLFILHCLTSPAVICVSPGNASQRRHRAAAAAGGAAALGAAQREVHRVGKSGKRLKEPPVCDVHLFN